MYEVNNRNPLSRKPLCLQRSVAGAQGAWALGKGLIALSSAVQWARVLA
jgi:hypothetical protein